MWSSVSLASKILGCWPTAGLVSISCSTKRTRSGVQKRRSRRFCTSFSWIFGSSIVSHAVDISLSVYNVSTDSSVPSPPDRLDEHKVRAPHRKTNGRMYRTLHCQSLLFIASARSCSERVSFVTRNKMVTLRGNTYNRRQHMSWQSKRKSPQTKLSTSLLCGKSATRQ